MVHINYTDFSPWYHTYFRYSGILTVLSQLFPAGATQVWAPSDFPYTEMFIMFLKASESGDAVSNSDKTLCHH